MTEAQHTILAQLVAHPAYSDELCNTSSDALRILYGLRNARLVTKDKWGRWMLTPAGHRKAAERAEVLRASVKVNASQCNDEHKPSAEDHQSGANHNAYDESRREVACEEKHVPKSVEMDAAFGQDRVDEAPDRIDKGPKLSRPTAVGEHVPVGVLYVYHDPCGDLHVCLDRRMKGKSVLISWDGLLFAKREDQKPPYASRRPVEIQKTGQGVIVRFDHVMRGRHILLEKSKLELG